MPDSLQKCAKCGGLIDEEDLFCANCGAAAPLHNAQETPARAQSTLSTHNFECRGCGASMSYDASAGALRCPFCGSQQLTEKQDARAMEPRRIVPFVIDRAAAEQTMRAFLGQGFWRPSDLAQQAAVVKMAPVYVPYWVFRAQTHTYWTADSSVTPPGARGDWLPLAGEHRGSYAGMLVGASGALTPAETAAICPYDLAAGRPPAEVDLTKVTVEQFAVARKYARVLARQGLESQEAATCAAQYVPGRSRNVKANVKVSGMSSEPVLLPVWIMAYRYRDQLFRFLVNGQTGNASGQAPFSYQKLFFVVGMIALGVVALLLLMGLLAAVAGGAEATVGQSTSSMWNAPVGGGTSAVNCEVSGLR